MVATRAQKRSAKDSLNPLQHAGILQRVLDYVGPGHWCFLAEVSSLWRDVYRRVAEVEVQAIGCYDKEHVVCVPPMTLYSAVLASPARVRHADAHELRCTSDKYMCAAGRHADVPFLQVAHALGMPYMYIAMMAAAARCNKLAVVQFLRAQGCPLSTSIFHLAAERGHIAMCTYLFAEQCLWDEVTSHYAARGGSVDALRLLRQRGCPWNPPVVSTNAAAGGSVDVLLYLQQQGIVFDLLTEMLLAAGAYSKLAAAKWLRQQGAEWPAVLCSVWYQKWSGDTLEWARAEGCTSPTEKYYDYEE
jgi:hypothetical protein